MSDYQLIPLIINGTMCFTTAVMLLTIKSYSQFGSNRFERIKQMLAYCGFLETAKVLGLVFCLYYHVDTYFMAYIDTDLYYLQLCMVSMGLLGLVHSPIFTDRKLLIAASPFAVFTLVHIIGYLIHSHFILSIESYLRYMGTEFAVILHWTTWIFTILEIVIFVYLLIVETRKYRHHLVNVYSGKEVVNGRKLSYLVYGFLAYLVMIFTMDYTRNDTFYFFYMLFIIGIYLVGVIVMFNIQEMYSRVMIVEDYMQSSSKKKDALPEQDREERNRLNTRVSEWESREDKPYLREGLTLVDVSIDMNLDQKQLSNYIENICKMSFDKWIDVHRIDEAIRLITANHDANLQDIAEQVGFGSLKNMTKSFHKIIGKDPEELIQTP